MNAYRIREVDGDDEVEALTSLHHKTFVDGEPQGDYGDGYWWIAYFHGAPVAFAGICEFYTDEDAGYFSRVGVLKAHRGNGLQLRLMRCLEAKARRVGWKRIITDTRHAVHSANNIIAAGYKLFEPTKPWHTLDTLYWTKDLSR